jgi:hypothetical protein
MQNGGAAGGERVDVGCWDGPWVVQICTACVHKSPPTVRAPVRKRRRAASGVHEQAESYAGSVAHMFAIAFPAELTHRSHS